MAVVPSSPLDFYGKMPPGFHTSTICGNSSVILSLSEERREEREREREREREIDR